MKIGIFTVHDSSNMGSFFQALGVQEMVLKQGDTPYIVETRSHFSTLCLFLDYNNSPDARSLKKFIIFVLRSIRHPKKTLEKYRKYKSYKSNWDSYKTVVPYRKAKKIKLDRALFGSDELWNVKKPAFHNPLFYGVGVNADKKIAYAISAGQATKEEISEFPNLVKGIKEIDSILIRDDYTGGVLKELGAKVDDRICDPTLQVDIRSYMRPAESVNLPKKKYIAVYSYGMKGKFREYIQQFAKENGLITVAVSLRNDWCDEYINCSPLEFGAVLSGAEYVFSATFHGTIFSALYHKQFVSLNNLHKIGDVLNLLGLNECAIAEDISYEDFCKALTAQHDFDAMEERLLKVRNEASELYKKYVKGE